MDDLQDRIEASIARKDYDEAAILAESVLAPMPVTAFHKILGRDLLDQAEEVAHHVAHFFEQALENVDVKAMYLEMNGFGINPDLWYFQVYAFSFCGNPDDPEDTDWLADYEFMLPETVFQITGYEDLQAACEDYLKNERFHDEALRAAKEAFEVIVTTRFIELLAHAVQYAKEKNLAWQGIPVFGTTHGETLLYRSPG